MAWTVEPVVDFSPEDVVATVNRHRLMPSLNEEAAAACMTLHSSHLVVIKNGSEDDVAKVFVSLSPGGGVASIDMIPTPRYFRVIDEFRDDLRSCMGEILATAFKDDRTRRVTALVPYSRGRTKKALRVAGFVNEGRIRNAVHFRRKDEPEDLFVLGMTAADYKKEYGDGT